MRLDQLVLMKLQMIRIISSPSSSTTGRATLIFAIVVHPRMRPARHRPAPSSARQDRGSTLARQAGKRRVGSAAGARASRAGGKLCTASARRLERGQNAALFQTVTKSLPTRACGYRSFEKLSSNFIKLSFLPNFWALGSNDWNPWIVATSFRGSAPVYPPSAGISPGSLGKAPQHRPEAPRPGLIGAQKSSEARLPAGPAVSPTAAISAATLGTTCIRAPVFCVAKPRSTMWSRSARKLAQ